MNTQRTLSVITLVLSMLLTQGAPKPASASSIYAPQGPGQSRLLLPLVVRPEAPQFDVSVGANPAEAGPGGTVTLESGLINKGGARVDVDITLTVVDANGQERFRTTWTGQRIDPGQVGRLSGNYDIAPTACEGQYRAGIVLKNAATGETLYANPAVASFEVRRSAYALSMSAAADRSNAGLLEGRTVAGNIYVFVSPEAGASRVRF